MNTKVITDDLINSVKAMKRHTDVEERHDQSCRTCNYVVDGVLQYRRAGVQKNEMMPLLEDLCVIFSNWSRAACHGRVTNEIVRFFLVKYKTPVSNYICS